MNKDQPFVGTWRVVEMELWDQADFDLLGPAHFTFSKNGLGEFQFVAVQGGMDCRFSERDGKPLVEFTWLGCDETDPVSGRGWAICNGDAITGRIFFHAGDDSAFTARYSTDAKGTAGKPRHRETQHFRRPRV